MALSLTRITGPLVLPDGEVPRHGRVRFALPGAAAAGTVGLAPGPVTAVLDADGEIDVQLQASDALDHPSAYAAHVTYYSEGLSRLHEAAIGPIWVPSDDVTIGEVLPVRLPMAGGSQVDLVRGDSLRLALRPLDDRTGRFGSLSGVSASSWMRRGDEAVTFSVTIAGGIIEITAAPAVTATLSPGRYDWAVRLQQGAVRRTWLGTILVQEAPRP